MFPSAPLTNISSSWSLAPALWTDGCNHQELAHIASRVPALGSAHIRESGGTDPWQSYLHFKPRLPEPLLETRVMPVLSTSVVAKLYQRCATGLPAIPKTYWPDIKMLILGDCAEL